MSGNRVEGDDVKGMTVNLWFDTQALDAAEFYVSVFPNSKLGKAARYSDAAAHATGRPVGSVMTVAFELNGQAFVGLNGGPQFKFSEAVSFIVNCESQSEIDHFWEKLSDGGQEGQCGWLKDKFGLSWQIVPTALGEMLSNPAGGRTDRAMAAMLQMKKMDIQTLRDAYDGK